MGKTRAFVAYISYVYYNDLGKHEETREKMGKLQMFGIIRVSAHEEDVFRICELHPTAKEARSSIGQGLQFRGVARKVWRCYGSRHLHPIHH